MDKLRRLLMNGIGLATGAFIGVAPAAATPPTDHIPAGIGSIGSGAKAPGGNKPIFANQAAGKSFAAYGAKSIPGQEALQAPPDEEPPGSTEPDWWKYEFPNRKYTPDWDKPSQKPTGEKPPSSTEPDWWKYEFPNRKYTPDWDKPNSGQFENPPQSDNSEPPGFEPPPGGFR
ncbi:hypothetical protein [Actinoplanes regularis]|uniref:hypothetical protein n=1 Tax=Actinoplanes regularis TaxID=52697 RepID=UPI0024A51CC8|nr:hypothetical protein [Actinoplanes regularis]GLW30483.1 hypothetical protein Areg01_34230 [Actinoplanes regularis]